MACVFDVVWVEDSTNTVLGRVTARNGSGDATGVSGEGNWLEQADVSSITCNVFDLESDTPETAIATPTVTVSDVILDTPDETDVIWTLGTGYNFRHDIAHTVFSSGDRTYRVQYKFTLADDSVFHGIYEGPVASLMGS